jgi:MAGE family
MIKQGYIVKVKDMVTGEPRFDYHLGPRGKVEVGKQGTVDFLAKVFCMSWNTNVRFMEMR